MRVVNKRKEVIRLKREGANVVRKRSGYISDVVLRPFDEDQYPERFEIDNYLYMRFYVTPRVVVYLVYYVSTLDLMTLFYCYETADGIQSTLLDKMQAHIAYEVATTFAERNVKNPKFKVIAK